MTINEEIKVFKEITDNMVSIFEKKRNDYGQTTTQMIEKYGFLPMVIKLDDKLGRLTQLLINNKEQKVKDESVEDTLLDLANYAIITMIELRKKVK